MRDKLSQFVRGTLAPADLLQDTELEAMLVELQKELQYPFSLSADLDLAPFGLLRALDQGALAILITDANGCIRYMNHRCEQLTGYSQNELIGKNPRIFKSSQTSAATYQDMWKSLKAGHHWSGELLNKRKNGSLYWESLEISCVLGARGEILSYLAVKQDITRRKLAESELKYQSTLLDSLTDAVLSTDLEMTILSWNRAAEVLYGRTESEVLGRNWLELQPDCVFTGISWEEVFEWIMQKGAWGGKAIQHDTLGRELPVFTVCSLVYNTQNSPSGLVIINRDLRQHQALQRSLEESETRFKQVADNLGEGVWSIDAATHTVVYMSSSMARLSGLSYQVLLDDPMCWRDYVHPDDREYYLQNVEQAKQLSFSHQSETLCLEYRFRCLNGEEKWFSSRIYASAGKIWGITEDITLRKRIQDEIIRSEKFAYGILGALSAHICVLNQQGEIIATNEAWNSFSATNQGDGNYLGWNYLAVCEKSQGEDRAQALMDFAGMTAVLAGREATYSLEYPCHSQQEQRWFELTVNRIEGDSERRVVLVHQDITTQKLAQKNLHSLNMALEEEVLLRTQALSQALKDLSQANQQLLEANRMKDVFLANMSHELRTPLTGILGMADLLSQQVLGPVNPKQAKSLQTLRSSGQHLLTLINDILDLSKVEAGKLELHPEWVEVTAAGQQLLRIVKPMAEEKNTKLSLRVEPFDLKIWADPRSFKQMLINLLSNAIKFTPRDGLVSLETRVQDNCVVVRVSDSGIGLAEADLARLFQRFVQIDSGLSREYAGTGLGLTLVKNLIQAHGGHIQVESQLGKGSVFSLYFPLKSGEHLSESNCGIERIGFKESRVSDQRYLILLVDDNRTNIEVIEAFLSHAGYRIISYSSATEALIGLETEIPDLILMDIQMPGMSGFGAIEQIRGFSQTAVARLPVIALTSLAMLGDENRIIELGFDSYLSKPVDFQVLDTMIKAHLGIKEDKAK